MVRKGHVWRRSVMVQVSLNQATWLLVMIHPPIPTVERSAHASAAARHMRGEGRAKGRSGAKVQSMLSRLSRRSVVCVASGLLARTHWVLLVLGTSGRSALVWRRWLLYSRSLQPCGMWMPRTGCCRCRLLVRAERKACQRLAWMAYWLPGGL